MIVDTKETKTCINSDAVWGAATIGSILGTTPRRAHYLLSKGALKETGARLVGGRWLVSRRKLEAFVQGDAADE